MSDKIESRPVSLGDSQQAQKVRQEVDISSGVMMCFEWILGVEDAGDSEE
jgi:hypothetical protein